MGLLLLSAFLAAAGAPAQAAPFSHDLLDEVLRAYVDSAGLVDYGGLKAARTPLDAYVDSLGHTSPGNVPERFPTRGHELAYWINAYNAFVLRGVIDAYPVASVKEIGVLNGFFSRKSFTAGGQDLTLNDIENKIVRPIYREPRVHFALNCGAVSCPPLAPRAFEGEDLDRQLEEALQGFARNPKYVRLAADGRLHLSKILEWYGQDFLEWFPQGRAPRPSRPTIVDYLVPYLPEETTEHLRQHPDIPTVYDEYDWDLNARR
ncbi:MAG: DUF547 domain-containing protein [Gemmatimonadota bacterium]